MRYGSLSLFYKYSVYKDKKVKMKQACKICILLGILCFCLLFPIQSYEGILETFKPRRKKRRIRQRQQQQNQRLQTQITALQAQNNMVKATTQKLQTKQSEMEDNQDEIEYNINEIDKKKADLPSQLIPK